MLALLRPMMTSILVTDGDRMDSLAVGERWNATTDQRHRLHWLRLGVKMLQAESGNTLVPFEAVAKRLGINESELWEFIVETMALSPLAFSIQEDRRHTWPVSAGEFGNAGVAYAFPHDEIHHTQARLEGIPRNLKRNKLYYGLKAANVSWLLKGLGDAADPKPGKIAFENAAVRARYRELAGATGRRETLYVLPAMGNL